MANPFYNAMGNNNQNGMQGIVQRFNEFRRGFKGNAQQQVQDMLNSGRISQQQLNQAAQMANQLQRMLGK